MKQSTGSIKMRTFYAKTRGRIYQRVAQEISRFSRFYDSLYQYRPRPEEDETLLQHIECPQKICLHASEGLPDFTKNESERAVILMNGNLNHSYDIEALLSELKTSLNRSCRVAIVTYNPYLGGLIRCLTFLGLRKGTLPTSFITHTDVGNLARLSGYEVVKIKACGVFPFIGPLALCHLILLRPLLKSKTERPSISILIPARNERENLEPALTRLPALSPDMEVVFVEGNSNDGTWEEIQRLIPLYQNDNLKISAYKQPGKGKCDAMRVAFAKATKDLVVILDADLTMPPELLPRFYDAYRLGLADFINGSRLVYPMEGEAMRPLNRLGNVFFAKALSLVLGVRIGDSLCGTKLFARHDYARFIQWKKMFGDFDPFGDFELLFPASILGLGIIDIPVRYRSRTYGTTNISRFSDGWKLLKMTAAGFFKLRLAPT